MTRATVVRLFVGSLIALGASVVLTLVAVAIVATNDLLIMDGPDVVGVRSGSLTVITLAIAAVAALFAATGSVAVLVGWIGAIINTAALPSKTWLVIELVVGLLGFVFVALLAYVVGAPDRDVSPAGRDLTPELRPTAGSRRG